jgi:hypothetical protein
LPSDLAMSGFRFSNNLSFSREDREEIVIVTSKQYLAVADDFLRKLFPELTPDRLPYPGPFTVFIADDVIH